MSLNGTFPSAWLPKGLQRARFASNAFTGSLPRRLASSLVELDLSGSYFSGAVPEGWALPEGLQVRGGQASNWAGGAWPAGLMASVGDQALLRK